MYEYRLRLDTLEEAEQLAQAFGIGWRVIRTTDEEGYETVRYPRHYREDIGEQVLDLSVLINIRKEDANGDLLNEMDNRLHVDIRSTHLIEYPGANQHLVNPKNPQHRWA